MTDVPHALDPDLDPFSAPASDALIALLCASPNVDALLDASITALDVDAVLQRGHGTGAMFFGHYGLRGPPNRLHGGVQCIARTLLVASRLTAFWPVAQRFPCAFWLRIGAPIPLRQRVPFEVRLGRGSGEARFLHTRFLDTPRLEAALWSRDARPLLSDSERAHFHARFMAALRDPNRVSDARIGVRYEHTRDLTFTRYEPHDLTLASNPWRRFLTQADSLSITLAAYQLDNTAAASRITELGHPCFTTRLALSLASAELPSCRPLVFLADRAHRSVPAQARARTVLVNGAPRGTETAEVLLASEDFAEVYAHGFVDTHPMPVA